MEPSNDKPELYYNPGWRDVMYPEYDGYYIMPCGLRHATWMSHPYVQGTVLKWAKCPLTYKAFAWVEMEETTEEQQKRIELGLPATRMKHILGEYATEEAAWNGLRVLYKDEQRWARFKARAQANQKDKYWCPCDDRDIALAQADAYTPEPRRSTPASIPSSTHSNKNNRQNVSRPAAAAACSSAVSDDALQQRQKSTSYMAANHHLPSASCDAAAAVQKPSADSAAGHPKRQPGILTETTAHDNILDFTPIPNFRPVVGHAAAAVAALRKPAGTAAGAGKVKQSSSPTQTSGATCKTAKPTENNQSPAGVPNSAGIASAAGYPGDATLDESDSEASRESGSGRVFIVW